MKKIYLLLLLVTTALSSYAQTCVINGPSTSISWSGTGSITCASGVNPATATILEIPSGYTINFDNVADTWTGSTIIVKGTLTISADVTINASLQVESTGTANLSKKLSLGSSPSSPSGCNYGVAIMSGGKVDVGSTGTDRLSICGTLLMQGNGMCNSCGGTNSGTCAYNGNPYCEPASGYFPGPLGYTQNGYSATLPVEIAYFNASANANSIQLEWATSFEENFSKFEIERSENGRDFDYVGEVAGAGKDLFSVNTEYKFEDKAPLLGYTYYRLKAVDLDGTYEYFGIRAIKISGEKKLLIYPNPASSDKLNFVSNFNPSEGDILVLKNGLGKEILQVNAVTNKLTIFPSQELNPGVYFLEYRGLDFKQTIRVVVTK
jgi:hypothetical protein